MNGTALHQAPTTARVPRRLAVMAGLTALGVVVLVGYTMFLVVDYSTYEGDDPLVGLTALLAFVTGAWALFVALLGGTGWLLRRRNPGLGEGLVISALTLVALPALGMLALVVPTWL